MKSAPAAAQRVDVSSHPVARTIETHGCSVALHRVDGRDAREIFLHCQPTGEISGAGPQAVAIYRAIVDALSAEGGGAGSIVAETIFLRDIAKNIGSVRAARREVLSSCGAPDHASATLEIEQPPSKELACLEVSLQAVMPIAAPLEVEQIRSAADCGCPECAGACGLLVRLGDEHRFHAAGLCGPGDDAYRQTLGMFERAESLLQKSGLSFRDVVRTWIHLRHMDRDYGALNRARREFFEARGIDPVPASTGIGGGPVSAAHDLCLGVYAVRSDRPVTRTVMTTPTLNEASEYGADFVRGMRVPESNRIALFVSGTASIDEGGRTVHGGDADAQADRMIVNISGLLQGQGAGFSDVVHAITYLKHSEHADRVRERLRRAGFQGFPHAVVVAPICRPELLCETEVLAVRPA